MINILICDGMEKTGIDKLEGYGYKVINKHYELEELKKVIKDFDVIIVRSATKVRKELIDQAKGGKLKLIIRGGVGLDNIDVEYATANGIKVRNTPNASSASVAELTIAHMFAISRYVHLANVTMRDGKWEKKKYEGIELFGKTLGLIGFGRIAKEVAKRAEALGMKVIYTDKLGMAKGYTKYEFCDLQNILERADFISLHIPFDKKVGAVIGKKQLEIMKDGVYIINCARGNLIDEGALIEALNNGKVAGAALDVFENEPKPNLELINNPKVCVTPHIGAATEEAQERIGNEIVDIVQEFAKYTENSVVNI